MSYTSHSSPSNLLDAIPDAIFVQSIQEDEAGKFVMVNHTACELYGYTQQEFLQRSLRDLCAPEAAQNAEELQRPALRGGETVTYETTHIAKSGKRFPVEVTAKIIEYEGEKALLTTVRDITKRKTPQQFAIEGEEYFRLAFQASPAAMSISRLSDGMVVDVNKAFCRITGYQREDVLGKTSTEIAIWGKPLNREKFTAQLEKEGRVENLEITFYTKDGRPIRALLSSQIFMLNGEPHLLNIAKDITDLVETRKKLEASEERFRKIFNASPDAITISRLEDQRFVEVNPAFTRLSGYTREEAVGKTAWELRLGKDEDAWENARQRLVKHRFLPPREVVFTRKDGTTIPGLISAAIIDLDDKPHILSIVHDISEIERARQSLREREQTLQALINASPDIICLKDGEGCWLEANQANLQLFELEDVEYRGKTDAELAEYTPFYREVFLTCVTTDEKAWEEGTLSRSIETVPRPDGSTRYYDVIKVPLFNEDGSRKGLVVIGRDVTAEQKARHLAETIQQANQALTSSLDLQTVLDALLSYLENLVPYDSASIMLRQSATEFSVLHTGKYERWAKPEEVAKTVFDIRTKPHLKRIVEEQTGVLIPDTREAPGWERIPGTEHVISWLGVPLIVGGEVIALYSLDKTEANFFTPEHLHLAESLGAQAAAAIKNALLYKEARQRAQDFATLYEASQTLAGKASLDMVFRDIAQYAYRLLGSAGVGIYRYNPTGQSLHVVLSTHPSAPVGTRLELGEGMAGRIAQSRQPMRVDDYTAWEGRSHQYEKTSFGAVLEVPMLYREELVGVLAAFELRGSPRKFTEEDERLLTLFATQAAAAIHSARLLEETRQRLLRIQTLRRIDRVIAGSIDINVTLNTVLDEVISQHGIDAASILLLEPDTLRLECAALRGFRRETIKDIPLRVGVGWPGRVVLERSALYIPDIRKHPRKDRRTDLFISEGFIAYRALPLIAKGKVQGVLEVLLQASFEADDEWNEFLLALAGQVAIALDNSTLFRNLERANLQLSLAYDATIEGWSHALDLRDKETEGHTQRVTEMTLELARAIGLEGEALLHIRRGALLHDIGKMGIPDAILHKPGPLTAEERSIIVQHPQLAYEMLSSIEYLHPALNIPYCHHEKWDGSGYPRGLKGHEIPLEARIFAIVDVYDALTSDRPYRKGWPKEKALDYIREETGKHFDPELVPIFLALFG